MRIDIFLSQRLQCSRNFIQHVLDRGEVLVGSKVVKKSYVLHYGDIINRGDLQRFNTSSFLADAPDVDIPVLYESDDYIVIDKPSGVLSHPNSRRDTETPSVVGWLHHRYDNIPSVQSFIRAGLVHRLDKLTRGVMLCALTERGLNYFANLFEKKTATAVYNGSSNRFLKKYYYAKVVPNDQGKNFINSIVQFPYLIDSMVYARMAAPVAAKRGLTLILDIKKGKNDGSFSFYLELLTGRTHQIRSHLAQRGCIIRGDYLYGGNDNVPFGLISHKLKCIDCYGKSMEFEVVL